MLESIFRSKGFIVDYILYDIFNLLNTLVYYIYGFIYRESLKFHSSLFTNYNMKKWYTIQRFSDTLWLQLFNMSGLSSPHPQSLSLQPSPIHHHKNNINRPNAQHSVNRWEYIIILDYSTNYVSCCLVLNKLGLILNTSWTILLKQRFIINLLKQLLVSASQVPIAITYDRLVVACTLVLFQCCRVKEVRCRSTPFLNSGSESERSIIITI